MQKDKVRKSTGYLSYIFCITSLAHHSQTCPINRRPAPSSAPAIWYMGSILQLTSSQKGNLGNAVKWFSRVLFRGIIHVFRFSVSTQSRHAREALKLGYTWAELGWAGGGFTGMWEPAQTANFDTVLGNSQQLCHVHDVFTAPLLAGWTSFNIYFALADFCCCCSQSLCFHFTAELLGKKNSFSDILF